MPRMTVHQLFAPLASEWIESRYATGDVGDGDDNREVGRDELAAFVASLSEESFYTAVQAGMERLDDLFRQKESAEEGDDD